MPSEWSQMTLRMVPDDPQNGPSRPVPRWSPVDLPDPDIDLQAVPSHMAVSNKALFSVLLAIAEL